jgi:hypothetical protein
MRGALAASLSILILLSSAGVAQADPRFTLTESQARAGEAVHFSIAGADGSFKYGLEVGDVAVLNGSAAKLVSGQFTMPDLGAAGKTVTVEARIQEPEDTTTATRILAYLPPAPPPAAPVQAPPASPPAAVAPAQPASQPTHSLPAQQQTEKRDPEPPRQHQRQSAAQGNPDRGPSSMGGKKEENGKKDKKDKGKKDKDKQKKDKKKKDKNKKDKDKKKKDKDNAGGGGAGKGGGGFGALNAIFPPSAASIAPPGAGPNGGPNPAILLPALVGLAALMLAGATLGRRRRLAGARAKAGDERLDSLARVERSAADLRRGIARRMRDDD